MTRKASSLGINPHGRRAWTGSPLAWGEVNRPHDQQLFPKTEGHQEFCSTCFQRFDGTTVGPPRCGLQCFGGSTTVPPLQPICNHSETTVHLATKSSGTTLQSRLVRTPTRGHEMRFTRWAWPSASEQTPCGRWSRGRRAMHGAILAHS